MANIDKLRRDVSLYDTARAYGVELEHDGEEWIGCCPFHTEKTGSFTLFQGRKDGVWRFQCFGCDEGGDVIDFVEKIKGVGKAEAINILSGEKPAGDNVPAVNVEHRDIYAGIELLTPPVDELIPGKKLAIYNPKRENTGSFAPSMVFPYRRLDGALLGYVLRHDLADGGKETPTIHWVKLPNGKECWARFPFPKPRPLYGLHQLGDDRQVVVVEGEKCRDALFVVRRRATVSWPGGSNGVAHTDWSPLRGRDLIIWPDDDAPGRKTAEEIAAITSEIDCHVRIMRTLKGANNARDDF